MIIGGRGVVIEDVIIVGLVRVMYVVTHVIIRVRFMGMDLTTIGRSSCPATRTAGTRTFTTTRTRASTIVTKDSFLSSVR
jgi:hypothetical protein